MNIRNYRLTSMEEPTDEMLHELMRQVAESARQSTINANKVLQNKFEETKELIRRRRKELNNLTCS